MRTIRSLLWIGSGRGLCESGMTEAPELDVTWVPSLEEAVVLPRVHFDGAFFEATDPLDVGHAAVEIDRWMAGTRLLASLPKTFEDDREEILDSGASAVLFIDSDQSGPGLVNAISQALDVLHETPAIIFPERPTASEIPRQRRDSDSHAETRRATGATQGATDQPTAAPDPPTPIDSDGIPESDDDGPRNVIPFVAATDLFDPRNRLDMHHGAHAEAHLENDLETDPDDGTPRVVSASRAMEEVSELIDLAASSPSTVLLTGETGVGKEVVAKQLHSRSCREDQPFIAINCAAFPESLLESELFGHVRGAFTGAERAKVGLFEAAGSGTLFLDEIAEMELPLQAKLLRVLQEREIRPIGATRSVSVVCRIVAATNRVLADEVQNGHFREDLFYRLNVFPIRIPPLRERRRDILPLVRYFLALHSPREGKTGCHLSLASAQLLEAYGWPGNVRELENEILRVLMLTPSGQLITPKSLSGKIVELLEPVAHGARPDETLREALERVESWLIRRALANNGGRRARTARKLGLTREGLYKKIRRLGIE